MRPFLVLVLVALVGPVAWAGTMADPEIVDRTGEIIQCDSTPWAIRPAVDEVDLTRVWFEQTLTDVVVHIQVVNLSHKTVPKQALLFWLTWGTPDVGGFAIGNYDPDPRWSIINGWWGEADAPDGTHYEDGDMEGVFDWERSEVSVTIPKTWIGPVLGGPEVAALLMMPNPTNPLNSKGDWMFKDRAPDCGDGPNVPIH